MIATQLKVDPDLVVGKLVRLWSWAEVNRIDGNEMNVTFEFIDKVVGKRGFGAALEKAGWIKEVGDRLQFPNFGRHNGPTGKGRALTAQRVSRHRDRKRSGDDLVTNDEGAAGDAPIVGRSQRRKSINERRNTVKDLIESEIAAENTKIEEVKSVTEMPKLERETPPQIEEINDSCEVVPVQEWEKKDEPESDKSVSIEDVFQIHTDYEDVTITAGDSEGDQADVETVAKAATDDRSEPQMERSETIEGFTESQDPERPDSEAEPEAPVQKVRKVRVGLGPTRKVVVSETPDQPLLF